MLQVFKQVTETRSENSVNKRNNFVSTALPSAVRTVTVQSVSASVKNNWGGLRGGAGRPLPYQTTLLTASWPTAIAQKKLSNYPAVVLSAPCDELAELMLPAIVENSLTHARIAVLYCSMQHYGGFVCRCLRPSCGLFCIVDDVDEHVCCDDATAHFQTSPDVFNWYEESRFSAFASQ